MTEDDLRTLDSIAADCLARVSAAPVVGRVVAGTATPDDLRRFSAQTAAYVAVTVPFLERAADRLEAAGGRPDHVAFLRRKAREDEASHDQWIDRDLAAQGGSPAEPTPAVRGYIELNRALIDGVSGLSFCGAGYMLECLSSLAPGAVERLTAAGVARREDLSFLDSHGALDDGHVQALRAFLRTVDDPAAIEGILLSARATATLYRYMFAG